MLLLYGHCRRRNLSVIIKISFILCCQSLYRITPPALGPISDKHSALALRAFVYMHQINSRAMSSDLSKIGPNTVLGILLIITIRLTLTGSKQTYQVLCLSRFCGCQSLRILWHPSHNNLPSTDTIVRKERDHAIERTYTHPQGLDICQDQGFCSPCSTVGDRLCTGSPKIVIPTLVLIAKKFVANWNSQLVNTILVLLLTLHR